MKKIVVVVEKSSTGYAAYTEDYPSMATGKTLEELKTTMLEGLNFYFEDKGRTVSMEDLAFKMDLPSFFSFYPEVNAAALSKKVGMNKSLLSQYVTGKKTPSEKQVQRIMEGVREVGRELASIQF